MTQNIRQYLKSCNKKITQQELADILRIGISTVQRREKTENNFELTEYITISRHFDIELRELLEGVGILQKTNNINEEYDISKISTNLLIMELLKRFQKFSDTTTDIFNVK